jgi:hypothetical protein
MTKQENEVYIKKLEDRIKELEAYLVCMKVANKETIVERVVPIIINAPVPNQEMWGNRNIKNIKWGIN